MHINKLDSWMHEHRFGRTDAIAERRTRWVILLTAVTMVVEILVGWLSGSMALLADGWHMATHVFALGITAFAYRFARRHRDNPTFTFGTGKVGSLAGFSSSIVLAMVAIGMTVESVSRILHPTEIHLRVAFIVACLGFVINLICAAMLHSSHSHQENHEHHHDHNLRAAFLHVAADALTSLLAIGALGAVYLWRVQWIDPAIGLLGAAVIMVWAVGLLRDTSRILLDSGADPATVEQIQSCIESDADNRVVDLHVWSLDGTSLSVVVSIVTHYPRPPEHYRGLLRSIPQVAHVTVEVNACTDEPCIPVPAERRAGQAPSAGTPSDEPST